MYSDVATLRRGSIELGVLVCNNTGAIMWVIVKVLKMNVLVDIGEASGALQWCHTQARSLLYRFGLLLFY
jgi:hypothetical protein